MTSRLQNLDYFAAKAMQALVTRKGNDAHYHSDLAVDAFNIAEAMLAERDRRNTLDKGTTEGDTKRP